ncbi:hypothetical protein AC249_AIPGENE12023 [Exaiptasia diaphana]|nr:hypothetical protein AC249_AIPGENE12023 [Exaiptasia diaphana]
MALIRGITALAVSAGIMGGGWLLMKVTTPDKEAMLKRLSKDEVSPERMAETERRNAELFKVLADNTKLDRPVWQVQSRPALDEALKKK